LARDDRAFPGGKGQGKIKNIYAERAVVTVPGQASSEPVRRGGIEKFFAEAGEPAKSRAIPPAPQSPPDLEQLVVIAARYGLHLLPPPGP
jgi:hypothetical protein